MGLAFAHIVSASPLWIMERKVSQCCQRCIQAALTCLWCSWAMSALHSRDTCFGYEQVSSRAWTSTAVPVGLCIKLIVMCCYLCVVMLWVVQSCCRRTEVTLTQFCLLGHKALLLHTCLGFLLISNFLVSVNASIYFCLSFWQTHKLTETNSHPSHQRNQPSLLLAVLNYGHEIGGAGDLPISLFPTKETAI